MDLPFRILVSAIVIGLTAPTVFAGLSAYESRELSVRAMRGIDAIVQAAQQIHLSGGGADRVRVDFVGGLTAHIEYVLIGDASGGSMASAARYKVLGIPEVFLLSDPPVAMEGEGGPLHLGPGRHEVRVWQEDEGPVRLVVIP